MDFESLILMNRNYPICRGRRNHSNYCIVLVARCLLLCDLMARIGCPEANISVLAPTVTVPTLEQESARFEHFESGNDLGCIPVISAPQNDRLIAAGR